jgi:hypothetical protein
MRVSRARAALLLVALGLGGWRALQRPPSSSLRVMTTLRLLAEASPPPSAGRAALPAPLFATAQASRPLDAETNLRELERLASSDKPTALQLALEADSKLPASGVLAEARRALIVTLLTDLNRYDEARARARAFGAAYPNSRYLPLVQGVTGVHPRPRPSELRDARAP